MLTSVVDLLDIRGEAEAWAAAAHHLLELTGASGAVGMEVMLDDRAAARVSIAIPIRLDDEFPIAPDSQAAFVARSPGVVVSEDLTTESRFVAGAVLTRCGIRSSVSARCPLGDGSTGVLGAYWTRPGACAGVDVVELELLVRVAGSVVAREREHRRLDVGARRDALTGLWNRAAAFDQLASELESRSDTSVLVLDLDGFKAVNDAHGHRAGDAALAQVARRIERSVPPGNLVARLGGDEFLIALR